MKIQMTVYKIGGEHIASDAIEITKEEYADLLRSLYSLKNLDSVHTQHLGDVLFINPEVIDSVRVEIVSEEEACQEG